MSSFWQRTLSGTVYVPLIVASILVHPIFFGVLFLVFTMWAVGEQHKLFHSTKFTTIGSMIAGGWLFALSWLFEQCEALSLLQFKLLLRYLSHLALAAAYNFAQLILADSIYLYQIGN